MVRRGIDAHSGEFRKFRCVGGQNALRPPDPAQQHSTAETPLRMSDPRVQVTINPTTGKLNATVSSSNPNGGAEVARMALSLKGTLKALVPRKGYRDPTLEKPVRISRTTFKSMRSNSHAQAALRRQIFELQVKDQVLNAIATAPKKSIIPFMPCDLADAAGVAKAVIGGKGVTQHCPHNIELAIEGSSLRINTTLREKSPGCSANTPRA